MRLSEAITLYLSERGPEMRPSTLSKYRATLNRFQTPEQAGDGPPFHALELDEITATEIRDFRDELVRRGIKPQSVNKYIDRVRAFFQYMTDTGHCPHNPAKGLQPLDEDVPNRVRLSAEVMGQLVATARHPRDRAMIAVAVEWLLRGGEIASIKVGDLNLDTGTCRVVVEKKKGVWREDELVVGPSLARELSGWLAHYRQAAGPLLPDAFLFPAFVRGSGSRTYYSLDPGRADAHPYRVVGYALGVLGVAVPGAGFHAIRRSMARLRYQALCEADDPDPIGVVKALLHHESRQQTEQYIGEDADRTRRNKIMRTEVWAKSSPLAQHAKSQPRHLSIVRP